MPLQTSVSQRPLTAQKRLRGASASRRHSQQVSAEATPRRRAAAQPGIPMFRSTSGNKHSGVQPSAIDALLTGRLQHQQQQQQQSTADSMQTSRMQKPQKSQHESQQGPTQHCRDPNNTLGFWQQQDAAQHQRHRSADYVGFPQGAAAQHGIFQGSAPQQVAEEVSRPVEHARSQEAAAAQRGLSQGLYSQGANVGHSSAVQQTRLPQKALGMQSSLPAPVMYVKPPWAIDDPYQVQRTSCIDICQC